MSRLEKRKLERLKKARKSKKIMRILILIVIVLAFIIYFRYYHKSINKENNYQETVQTFSTTEQNVINNVQYKIVKNEETGENKIVEYKINYVLVEYAQEAQEVKSVINKYITDKNLSENNFAFFYYNPSSKQFYFYNEDKFFAAASTIKVPTAMAYYDKINNGELTLDYKLKYDSTDFQEGGGTTNLLYKPNDEIPISFLLQQMIVNSDNTAWQILIRGLGGYSQYKAQISKYTNRELQNNFDKDNIISAKYGYDIIKYLYEHQEEYKELISYMKKSSGGGYLKKNIKNYEIAHKYGSFEGNIHDYGIVYADKPYLIGIFTNGIEDAENLIADINKDVLELHKNNE